MGQSEGGGCGTTDVVAIGHPLVTDGAQTVGICEVVTGGQYLTLGRGAAYRDTARGGVIDIVNINLKVILGCCAFRICSNYSDSYGTYII